MKKKPDKDCRASSSPDRTLQPHILTTTSVKTVLTKALTDCYTQCDAPYWSKHVSDTVRV